MTDTQTSTKPLTHQQKRKGGNPAWVKGVSGNPSGRNGLDKPISVLARAWAPKVLNRLGKIALDPQSPHSASVAASQAILDRAYGKAPTFSTSDAEAFRKAVDMTDDQLAAIASNVMPLRVIK